jgi:ubiquinone/menaquinone biosynthesis C-methylase UbiE
MTDRSQESLVAAQFGPRAAAYVASPVHAQGEDLRGLAALAAARPGASVLDLGCGGGHVSVAVAPHAARVVAFDLSAEMLGAVAAVAAERGLANIVTEQGSVTALPFGPASFDIVLSRLSAHHWPNLVAGLAEARRVLKPDGIAVFIDVAAPGDALLDTHLQAIELLRDPSHVRDYSIGEWRQALTEAGFRPGREKQWRLAIAFQPWIERMQTAEDHVRAIRSLQRLAPDPVRRHFAIQADGSYMLDAMSIEAVPVAAPATSPTAR